MAEFKQRLQNGGRLAELKILLIDWERVSLFLQLIVINRDLEGAGEFTQAQWVRPEPTSATPLHGKAKRWQWRTKMADFLMEKWRGKIFKNSLKIPYYNPKIETVSET